MSFRIVLETRADREIEDAYHWMAQLSPERALDWYCDILERIETLQNNPFRCPIAAENNSFPEEIRHLIFGQYRILFTVRDETVHVLRVRHGRRDYAMPEDE
ncbi:MAG: type II toxin-antitoxin system RelE/ParE family toxin [Acidobacteriota bacterium]